MIYKGTITARTECDGSKSEGDYAYLNDGQMEYRLFREGMFPADDEYLLSFYGKEVEIEGTATEPWLSVKTITEVSCISHIEENKGTLILDNCIEPETNNDTCESQEICGNTEIDACGDADSEKTEDVGPK